MKMLNLKNTAAALMAVLLSTNVYAMDNDEENRPTARTAALSPADTQEKDAFKAVIKRAVPDNDFNAIDTALRHAEGRPWFDQKGVDWILELATFQIRQNKQKPVNWLSASPDSPNIEDIIEKLLSRKGSVRPSLDCVVSVFTNSKDYLGDAKVAMIDYLAQQGAIQRVLGQINVNDTLSEASHHGRLSLVQSLLEGAPNQPLTNAIKSAAENGHLETFNYLLQHARDHGTFTKDLLNESLKSAANGYSSQYLTYNNYTPIRDLVNQLLNMGHQDGPTQEAVDTAFIIAAKNGLGGSELGNLRLVKIMLLDRATGKLRTGLRPSNEVINMCKTGHAYEDIADFLNTLNL